MLLKHFEINHNIKVFLLFAYYFMLLEADEERRKRFSPGANALLS